MRDPGQGLLRRVCALALVATVTTGCGALDGLGGSDFAQQDAETIARAAYADMDEVTSMRINGTMLVGGNHFVLDLQLSEDQCTGSYRQNRGEMEIRQTPRANWFRGDRAMINDIKRLLPENRRAEARPDRWLKSDEGHPWCELKTWVSGFKVRKDGTDGDGRPMHVGEETELDGVEVVEIITEIVGVDQQPVAYVAVDEPHRVLRAAGDDPRGSFNMAYSRYDDEFEVTPPNP